MHFQIYLFMIEQPLKGDTPIEVKGFVTDPKRVGYQVLTNYENIYWGTLVDPIAWRLYQILRGFCNNENRVYRDLWQTGRQTKEGDATNGTLL